MCNGPRCEVLGLGFRVEGSEFRGFQPGLALPFWDSMGLCSLIYSFHKRFR